MCRKIKLSKIFKLRSLVRYCSCHSNIKFISSRHRVISSLYFIYESRGTLKSFALCIIVKTLSRGTLKSFALCINVKTITILNLEQSDKFEIEILKISRRDQRSPTTQNLVISRCCFTKEGKEMYQE